MTLTFKTVEVFPESEGFELQLNIEGADIVNDLSIVADMPCISISTYIDCFSEFSDTSSMIRCQNIGILSSDSDFAISFAFISL